MCYFNLSLSISFKWITQDFLQFFNELKQISNNLISNTPISIFNTEVSNRFSQWIILSSVDRPRSRYNPKMSKMHFLEIEYNSFVLLFRLKEAVQQILYVTIYVNSLWNIVTLLLEHGPAMYVCNIKIKNIFNIYFPGIEHGSYLLVQSDVINIRY